MRSIECLELGYFGFLGLRALGPGLPPLQRRRARWLAACGLGGLALGLIVARALAQEPASILRDWLPAPLILFAYWLPGAFYLTPHLRLEQWLARLDLRLLGPAPRRVAPALDAACELAYLLCYPLPPLGLGLLYLSGLRRHADFYWIAVLAPSYICYLTTALWPTRPPRLLQAAPSAAPRARRLNLWVLDHLSIGINTFPSAHVTAAVGMALALLELEAPFAIAALALAGAITLATFVGRYHFLADAALGATLAIAVWIVARASPLLPGG